jgi:hypothetical protein
MKRGREKSKEGREEEREIADRKWWGMTKGERCKENIRGAKARGGGQKMVKGNGGGFDCSCVFACAAAVTVPVKHLDLNGHLFPLVNGRYI